MSSSEKEVAAKMYTDKNLFAAQVFQCIAYITHKCPLLQELFLKWTNLGIREKVLLNYIAFHIVEKGQIELYTAIIQGFGYWNTLQDTEGACGFHENPLDFKFDSDDEKRIFQIILIIDKIISNLILRTSLCKEIKDFEIKSLTSHTNHIHFQPNAWGDR